ncbi:unnamed protein product [Sphagnum jensenii]|uniref:Uncharacterized protein n=1 Tax=Sphagnum jensenii TaxID=128206 RepID=A0ABP1AVX7_9BRYO
MRSHVGVLFLIVVVVVSLVPAACSAVVQQQQQQQQQAANAAIAVNCSDSSQQGTPECVSESIDCWSMYIENSSVIISCESFTAMNSTLSSPTPDCCSTVQTAWQLWPRRCFCNYIYFQYVTERRHSLPALCNVTNSLCQICESLHPPDPAVATCGGQVVPGQASKHKVKALTVALALVTTALVIGIIVITTWLACSCCKKKKTITSNPKKVPDSTQDLYVDRTF